MWNLNNVLQASSSIRIICSIIQSPALQVLQAALWLHLKFSIIVFQEIQISKEYERIWSIHSCAWIPLPTSPFCLKKVQSAVSCKKLQKERFSLKKLEYAKSRDFWVGFCQTGLNTTGATFQEHAIIDPEEKIIVTKRNPNQAEVKDISRSQIWIKSEKSKFSMFCSVRMNFLLF